MPIVDLATVEGPDRRLLGGKALGLRRLMDLGLPVPPALVVTTDELERFLRYNDLLGDAERAGVEMEGAIASGQLPPAFAGSLRQAAAELCATGDGELVVRSSAVGEDAADASFAGQYETVVGVLPGDATERAVLACWASVFSARVRAYRAGEASASMAVILQPLIQSRCAGVMFTVNPMSGSWREMVVEAAWGQGDSVVSGRVAPDFYVVRRPRRTPAAVQRVLARARLQVLRDEVREQSEQWVVDEGQLRAVAVPAAQVGAPKLRHAELLALCRLGLRIEASLGAPQDIEWARDGAGAFWIVQTRPVTAQPVRRAGQTLWTRRFIGERWTQQATPLGWSEMRDLLHHFIAYPRTARSHLGGAPPTRLVRFAPYLNVTVFRHLAFKLPGAPVPAFMLELLPPDEARRWLTRRAQAPSISTYFALLRETLADRRWERFRWNPLTNWRAWDALERSMRPRLAALSGPIGDRADALARIEACRELARDYIKVHVCSLLFANIWFQLSQAALEMRGEGSAALELLRPAEETWTQRTNRALWHLGRGLLSLDDFLERFGHRADSSWELFSPRWQESPERALELARVLGQGPEPEAGLAPDARELSEHPAWLRRMLWLTQRYLRLREDQRFVFDQLLWAWKRAYLWLEADLGLELRYLERAEVTALVEGRLAEPRALITRRRDAWMEEQGRRQAGDEPPDFLEGDEVVDDPGVGDRLEGLPISPGVFTGPARVARNLEEAARLEEGEVLVARATDPSWTPLFPRAGALVLELGGALSHGAVVAREYGLPAVANVAAVTQRVQNGQVVTVDGTRGAVLLR